MDYETLKKEYNELISKKKTEVIHKKERISKEITLIDAVLNKRLELEQIKDVLTKNNINNPNAYKFLNLFEESNINIKSPSVSPQYNNFLNLIKPSLDESKHKYEEEFKTYTLNETELATYNDIVPSIDNINKLENSKYFTEEEKLLIVKYMAYSSLVKEKEKTKPIEVSEKIEIGSIEVMKNELSKYEPTVTHILEKKENSHFDPYYDALTLLEIPEDSENKELVDSFKERATTLNNNYESIIYSYENLINAINDNNYTNAGVKLEELKEALSKYEEIFKAFKKLYPEFNKVFGNLIEKPKKITKVDSYAIDIVDNSTLDENAHAIEILDTSNKKGGVR